MLPAVRAALDALDRREFAIKAGLIEAYEAWWAATAETAQPVRETVAG